MRNLLTFFAVFFAVSVLRCGVQAQPLQPWTLHISNKADGGVRSVVWSGDGKTVVIGSENELQIRDARTKRRRRTIRVGFPDTLTEVSLSSDGKIVAGLFPSFKQFGALVLWDSRNGRVLRRLNTVALPVFWKSRFQLFGGGANGNGNSGSVDTFGLQTYNFRAGQFAKGWELPAPRGLNFIEFSTAASGPSPPIWTLAPDARRGAIALLKIVPIKVKIGDKKYGYARNESRGVLIFDVRTGKHRRILPASLGRFGSLQFSPDGRVLIVAGRDIELWDVARSRLRLRFNVKHDAGWSAVAMSPNNHLLAVGNDLDKDGGPYVIRLWNARNGRLVRELKGHRAGVTTLAFSPDGKTLASGSDDGTVKLWRLK